MEKKNSKIDKKVGEGGRVTGFKKQTNKKGGNGGKGIGSAK